MATGHGVASSCASITNSILASPHGASEEYIMSRRSSRRARHCCPNAFVISCSSLRRSIVDVLAGEDSKWLASWRRKWFSARIDMISACQSCRTWPAAKSSGFNVERHLIPVLSTIHWHILGSHVWYGAYPIDTHVISSPIGDSLQFLVMSYIEDDHTFDKDNSTQRHPFLYTI